MEVMKLQMFLRLLFPTPSPSHKITIINSLVCPLPGIFLRRPQIPDSIVTVKNHNSAVCHAFLL